MKPIVLITVLTAVLFSCNKAPNRPIDENKQNPLSTLIPSQDSSKVKNENSAERIRTIEADTITVETDASEFPLKIDDRFTNENQFFVLKIKNVEAGKISVIVQPKNDKMNIRINQIKLPNGEFDGPFGRDMKEYPIPEKGEVWLRIGKSNMASGAAAGNFSLQVE